MSMEHIAEELSRLGLVFYGPKIQQWAIAKWGEDRWLANITREYVKITQEGDVSTRKAQIKRAFVNGGCNLSTAITLAKCVGCNMQLAHIQVEIEDF
jgi:predicted metal-binding protein